MSMSQMLMMGARKVVLPASINVSDTGVIPLSGFVGIQFTNSGTASESAGASNTPYTPWLAPAVNPGDYEIALSTLTGSVAGSAVDTWLNLGTTRTWTITRNAPGTSTFTGILQIRYAGGALLAQCNVSMSASQTS